MPRKYDPSNPAHVERNRRYQAEWYAKNRKTQIARVRAQKERNQRFVQRVKSFACCSNCGFEHSAALVFHHREGTKKESNLANAARKGWSITKLKAEMRKCEIWCSNCHLVYHYGQRPAGGWGASYKRLKAQFDSEAVY